MDRPRLHDTDRPRLQHVAQAPTNPRTPTRTSATFDVADLYLDGPVPVANPEDQDAGLPLDEKLRQAYFWIVNRAVISPHYDLDFHDGPSPSFTFGDSQTTVTLPSGQSYSSFALIPLLTLAVRGRCLLVGGPGRGKTATATLLAVLAGHPLAEVRRGMQHGHPQMTIADLLGNPLPGDLMTATTTTDIRIAWRRWLDMRVRIIDEYNRIPTRTQSALLTLMGDSYAEMLDQVKECPPGAWFLTANDDAGGGTYQVIDALRDRIDVVVKALAFNPRFLGALLDRIEAGYQPADVVPPQLVLTEDELDRMHAEVLAVGVPPGVRRRLEFFASQLEFDESGATILEYQTKDTIRLSGIDRHLLSVDETGRDRLADLGVQTLNGLSVRALMTTLTFAKAMAWFRGNPEVGLDDLRHVIGFVLHDRLVPDLDAPFFEAEGNAPLRADRISWIRTLFDLSCADHDRQGLDDDDPVGRLLAEFEAGLDGLGEGEVRARLATIEGILATWARGGKLYGTVADDILAVKYLHQRYTNYLAWLTWRG